MSSIASIEITNLVMKSTSTLDERLVDLFSTNESNATFLKEIELFPIHNLNGFSGYNFWVNKKLTAQLHFAALATGYYVFLKRSYQENETYEMYDYYDINGNYTYTSDSLDGTPINYSSINMDPDSPFANYLYNIAHLEYENARTGNSNTKRVLLIETILNNALKDNRFNIAANYKYKDPAYRNITGEMLRIEKDPILKWSERKNIHKSLAEVRKKIIATKKRAHNYNPLTYSIPLSASTLKEKYLIFKQRPLNNLLGFIHRITIGNLIWFCNMVKSNLGLSVAMAIYGPFTFYFITQPMNPHAMWTVGKVREAYLDIVNTISGEKKEVIQVDHVNSGLAATQKIILEKTNENIAQSWDQRMSNFKAMQIGYEESLVFAERMGRVEHMENQFLFPLTAQGAWYAMNSYINDTQNILKYNKNLDYRYISFLKEEIKTARENQIYVWKKMIQFLKDHPYMVMDQNNEQPSKDFYTGNVFVFMNEITEELASLDIKINDSINKKIKDLAAKYELMRIQGDTTLETLKKSTKTFSRKDIYSSDEMRKELKRHWEVLFLQQNKKQEAASFGLQAYTWSIKNTIWIVQSIYTAKREDLGTLTYKFNLENKDTDNTLSNIATNKIYESMLNMLVIDFVAIKKEIASELKNDSEASQRTQLIDRLRGSINNRDKLFNIKRSMAQSNSSNETRI